MKSIVYRQYGSAEVITVAEQANPLPKDNEVLIRVRAAAVTPPDCAFRKGDPFPTRLMTGLLRPKFTPGFELSGEIESVGKNVTSFKPGDTVFGSAGTGFGAHAGYKCFPESGVIGPKPANLSFGESVAICDGGLTALVFLRDVAELQSGQTILINGASGAVGAYAIQLAKYYGAEVTAVCSRANREFVRSIGADHVIDYTATDFTSTNRTYDVIFDAVGKSSFRRCKSLLKPKGIFMTTEPGPGILLRQLWTSVTGGKKARFAATGLQQRKENLLLLGILAEAGKLIPTIDKSYPFEQMADAHRYVETGRKRGNVVVTLE
jgi:NADPH:quinone reductase-like Zn-dependent oxidoreductase